MGLQYPIPEAPVGTNPAQVRDLIPSVGIWYRRPPFSYCYFTAHGMVFANIATMQALLKLLLEHPERFDKGAIPCCLWGFLPTDDPPLDDHMQDITKPRQPVRLYGVVYSH